MKAVPQGPNVGEVDVAPAAVAGKEIGSRAPAVAAGSDAVAAAVADAAAAVVADKVAAVRSQRSWRLPRARLSWKFMAYCSCSRTSTAT